MPSGEMARKLTRKAPDGRYEVKGASIHLPRTWVFSNGGVEFDDVKRPTRSFYDSEESLQAIQFLHSLIWEDDAAAMYTALNAQIGANDVMGFAQGKVEYGYPLVLFGTRFLPRSLKCRYGSLIRKDRVPKDAMPPTWALSVCLLAKKPAT